MANNKEQSDKDVLERLKRAEGQIKAVREMYEGEEDPLEITQQITAARSALGKIAVKLLEEELEACYQDSSKDRFSKVLESITKIS